MLETLGWVQATSLATFGSITVLCLYGYFAQKLKQDHEYKMKVTEQKHENMMEMNQNE